MVLFKEDKQMAIPTQIMGLRVAKVGLNYKVSLELIGLTINWDAQRTINIEATAALFNRTAGLCGTIDQDPTNDFTSKDGTVHKVSRKLVFVLNCFWHISRITFLLFFLYHELILTPFYIK